MCLALTGNACGARTGLEQPPAGDPSAEPDADACSASSCSGCCDLSTCRSGNESRACGTHGAACKPCSGLETCGAGQCSAPIAVLFGGTDQNGTLLGDTWQWDGSSWKVRKVVGPSARAGHAMASLNGTVVLFGGISGAPAAGSFPVLGDTWEWDGSRWIERKVPGPKARAGHAMATLAGKVVLFGGTGAGAAATGSYLGDTWEWDGRGWTERHTNGPTARIDHAMATLSDRVLLYGGIDDPTQRFRADAWEWSGSGWALSSATSAPGERAALAMARSLDGILLFGGGVEGSGVASQTWEWLGTAWVLRASTGPSARAYASMAALNGEILLFGGGGTPAFAETWLWDGTAWARRDVAGPSARNSAAMCSQ